MSGFTSWRLTVLRWSPWFLPTQCVGECEKCGFSRQANTAWGPMPKRSPIQYGRPKYIRAYMYVCTKRTRQNWNRSHNMVVAYRGSLTHKPITAHYCKRCYFRVTKFSRLAAQKHIRGLLNSRWADAHLSFWYCTMLTSFNEWYIYMYVCNWVAQKQSRSQTDLR